MDEHEHTSEEHGLPLQHALTDWSDRNTALVAGAAGSALLLALAAVGLFVAGDASLWVYLALSSVTIALLFGAYRKLRVWAGWGNPQLFLPSSEPLHLGDHVVVRFRRVAKGRADPAGMNITARVQVDEVTSSQAAGIHASSGTHHQVLRVYEAAAPVVMLDVVGQTVEADFAVHIPLSDAPPSLELLANEVRWRFIVHIEAPNAPDDDSTFPLVVAPTVAARLQSGGSGR